MKEQDIQRIFPVFLKEFYKHRYEMRFNSMQGENNLMSQDGIIADGRIQFVKEDGSTFTCTFEATSADKIEEVKYTTNMVHFLWDCATFALAMTMASYALLFIIRRAFLHSLTVIGNIGVIIGLLLLFFSLWYFMFQSWKKYRYIYAIEQFKRYFADEQWVAIAKDVFPSLSDPYMIELRNQCVYNGFGLAVVEENGEVQALVTPSRLGIYGKDRRQIQWLTDTEVYQGVSKTFQYSGKATSPLMALLNKIFRPIFYLVINPIKNMLWRILTLPFGQKSSAYDGFMRGFNSQKITSLGSVALLGFLFWNTVKTMPVKEIDGYDAFSAYEKRQKELGYKNPEDESGIVYDDQLPITYSSRPKNHIPKQDPTPANYNYRSNDDTRKSSKPSIVGIEQDDEGVQTINLSGDDEAEVAETVKPSKPKTELSARTTAKSGVSPAKPTVKPLKTNDSCAMINHKKGWIVQDNYFTTRDFAEHRITALQKAGLKCSIVQGSCLNRSSSGYVVLYNELHKSEQNAVSALEKTRNILSKNKIAYDRMFIRALGEY